MSEELTKRLEALLLVSAKPLTESKLSSLLKADKRIIGESLASLQKNYQDLNRGFALVKSASCWQLVTAPDCAKEVSEFLKQEVSGELSRPSLEALTIIAYRGPITKAELEQIRGVNCSLILRNLLIRGLIEEVRDSVKVSASYQVTVDLLKYLGLRRVSELPNFTKLNNQVRLESFLQNTEQEKLK